MKFKLPKALLVAVLASSTAFATMRPEKITTVQAGKSEEATEEFMTYQQTLASGGSDGYATIGTITKDGQGQLTVSQDYNVKSSLQVREGELYIGNGKDAEHVTILAQPYKSESPTISVGGSNASLVLDNATYKYYVTDNSKDAQKSYVSAITIGNVDGSGSIELKNGSTLLTSQSYFAYRTTCAGHVQGSYAGTKGDDMYNNEGNFEQRSKLTITGASKVQAGITFYFADIDISISGEGSIFEDGVRAIDATSGWLGDEDGSGATDVVTNVTISDGGTWTSRHDLKTSAAETATTNILVTGTGSTFNSNRNTYLGNNGGKGGKTYLTVAEGATANIVDLNVGIAEGTETAEISINGAESTLNAGKIIVNKGGSISNEGKIVLGDKTKVTALRDDSVCGFTSPAGSTTTEAVTANVDILGTVTNSGLITKEEGSNPLISVRESGSLTNSGIIELDITVDGGTYLGDGDADQFGGSVFTILDGSVVEGLTMTTGTVNISGEVSLTNVTFGTVINAAELMMLGGETDTLTVYIQQGSVINADDLNLGDGTNVAVVLDEGVIYEDGMELFTLTGSDSTQISELEAALGNNLAVYEYGNTEGEGTVVENATGSIATNVVPEPTTATLSLLALCGLCARRRRK